MEAKTAIEVGRLYRDEQQVFVFRKLLIERFLRDVPEDMAKKYNSLLFNRSTARLFNEEMIQTIKKFFENSLNLSETARQLYIHRNTLVYRLDKVQRNIGLDLRDFDDAGHLQTDDAARPQRSRPQELELRRICPGAR